MFAFLGRWITTVIATLGYPGVFILMAMESMLFPIPSELVMPFAGYLVSQGTFSFWTVAIVSAFGCLLGSLLSYAIGYYGATPLVRRYGKYLFIEKKHLTSTERYFKKHGSWTVFVCRFIPVIRHISSIPAGAGKMKLWTFSLYSFVGALIWNTFLLWVGFTLGKNWALLSTYTPIIDAVIVVAILIGIVYVYKKLTR